LLLARTGRCLLLLSCAPGKTGSVPGSWKWDSLRSGSSQNVPAHRRGRAAPPACLRCSEAWPRSPSLTQPRHSSTSARLTSHPDAHLRASLIAAQLVGIAMLRHVIRVQPIAGASSDEIANLVAPSSSTTCNRRHRLPHRPLRRALPQCITASRRDHASAMRAVRLSRMTFLVAAARSASQACRFSPFVKSLQPHAPAQYRERHKPPQPGSLPEYHHTDKSANRFGFAAAGRCSIQDRYCATRRRQVRAGNSFKGRNHAPFGRNDLLPSTCAQGRGG
jgi:hypothetical protein